jgi:transcriptional regulator with GAF, ATPase, and Fis domain
VPTTSEQLKQVRKEARNKATADVEKKFLLAALEKSDWNVTNAAKDTGMDRRNFQNLMRKHGLKR